MLRKIDEFLNGITMYRLLLYGLGLLAIICFVLGITGELGFSPLSLALSLGILTGACYGANWFMRRMWEVPTNTESWLITALILFFVLPPTTTLSRAFVVAAVGCLAMASKYILAYHGRHFFNPAAIALVIAGLAGMVHPTWWVGSSLLWPFVLLLGLLVIRKIRRFHLFWSFLLAVTVVTIAMALLEGWSVADTLRLGVVSSPLLFLGMVMLTEPSTMPSAYRHRIIFGALVGALYAWHPEIGPIYVYPEVALIAGNIYAYAVNPTYRLRLRLKEVVPISSNVYDIIFTPDRKANFTPGQYLEWTLPHTHVDDRGNRRTFTIASSPTEDAVHLGIKTYKPSSSFKQALLAMEPDAVVYAGQVSGSFTLPEDASQKLLFIAGGIGVTPFRSMIKYLIDTNEQRDIVLLYAVANPAEIAYRDIFEAATAVGVKFLPVLTTDTPTSGWAGLHGMVNKDLLVAAVPDVTERMVYLSGPHAMVEGLKRQVKATGIPAGRIKDDYFPGY